MKKLAILCGLLSLQANAKLKSYEWAVIGAGPAGIAAVGLFLDLGIPPQDIAWIDEAFNVGRIGKYYANVPGNAPTEAYIQYIEACQAFNDFPCPERDKLYSYDLHKEYKLQVIIEPLKAITNHLRTKVDSYMTSVISLDQGSDETWCVKTQSKDIYANKVVLATGCHPKKLSYHVETEIPLDSALDKGELAQWVNEGDTVAVIGGSHSGMLVAKNLAELKVARIINFYKWPLIYSFDTGNNNVIYFNGLCGPVGRWAYNYVETNTVPNLVRVKNSVHAREAWLPLCNKIVYAVGYERNDIPCIASIATHNPTTGDIAPNLFGIGIAYPEIQPNALGEHEKLIGLPFFMQYALKIMPSWISRSCSLCHAIEKFCNLFVLKQ